MWNKQTFWKIVSNGKMSGQCNMFLSSQRWQDEGSSNNRWFQNRCYSPIQFHLNSTRFSGQKQKCFRIRLCKPPCYFPLDHLCHRGFAMHANSFEFWIEWRITTMPAEILKATAPDEQDTIYSKWNELQNTKLIDSCSPFISMPLKTKLSSCCFLYLTNCSSGFSLVYQKASKWTKSNQKSSKYSPWKIPWLVN